MRMYFVHLGGKQYGPYPETKIKSMNLAPNTPVWCEGMSNWAPLSQVMPTTNASPSPQQRPQPSRPQPQPVQTAQPARQPVQNLYQQQASAPVQHPEPSALSAGDFKSSTAEQLSLWGYYKKCWSNYAVFSGRARRSEYWSFALFNFLIMLAVNLTLSIVVFLILLAVDDSGAGLFVALPTIGITVGIASFIYWLAILIPSLAVTSRRFHDSGKSFWWFLLVLTAIIPFVGIIGPIILLIFTLLGSDPMQNQYGPNPKA